MTGKLKTNNCNTILIVLIYEMQKSIRLPYERSKKKNVKLVVKLSNHHCYGLLKNQGKSNSVLYG